MPDGSNMPGPSQARFSADRRLARQGGFVARLVPEPPAPQAVGMARRTPGAAVPKVPAAAAQVAADLRSGRSLARPAEALPLPVPPGDLSGAGAPDPAPPATPPPDPVADAARLADARAQGEAEGRAAALAELAAERQGVAQAAQALAVALARLAEPAESEIEMLAQVMEGAVARLAAERAGSMIDAVPEGFAARVARLADRIARHHGGLTVRLNPQDLAAIRPLLAGTCAPDLAALAAARLVADPALHRGDADLHTPDVRVADLCELPGGPADWGDA